MGNQVQDLGNLGFELAGFDSGSHRVFLGLRCVRNGFGWADFKFFWGALINLAQASPICLLADQGASPMADWPSDEVT